MAIRPELRWLVITALIVAILLGISALALDRPNVVWSGTEPQCPSCREEVEMQATRCPHCTERFDWVPLPDEASPISPYNLSAIEDEWVRRRVQELGPELAAQRVATALAIDPTSATRWLARLARGRCGWCGGSGIELPTTETERPCRVCQGSGACVSCGGDRRVRVDDPDAAAALRRLTANLADLERARALDPEAVRAERTRLIAVFLDAHAGTKEALRMPFLGSPPAGHTAAMRASGLERPRDTVGEPAAVERARERLDLVLKALASEGS